MLLSVILKLLAGWIASRVPIETYDCSVDGADDEPAKMRHGFGFRADPNSPPMSHPYRVDAQPAPPDRKPAWVFSQDRPRGRNREHTLYGPYTNDFGYPRLVRVSFLIAGTAFTKSPDPLIVLDVLRAPFGGEKEHTMLGQKIVRGGDLRKRYRSFDVTCDVPGPGVYEYRATINQRPPLDPARQHIFFKSVRIYRGFRPLAHI